MDSQSRPPDFTTGSRPKPMIWITVVAIGVVVVLVIAVIASLRSSQAPSSPPPPPQEQSPCPKSFGLCIERNVTRVTDGDTLDVEGDLQIRLVLVDAPELYETGGSAAQLYLENLCLNSLALIDEDDFQIGDDPYGRVIAVVYCRGTNANAAMISSGHAETYYEFCDESEFGKEEWTGCASAPPPPPPAEDNCDPSYPTVCIPPPPPDLNCDDIPYRNFVVLPPDPHHFDGDEDGIGCEN